MFIIVIIFTVIIIVIVITKAPAPRACKWFAKGTCKFGAECRSRQ